MSRARGGGDPDKEKALGSPSGSPESTAQVEAEIGNTGL